MIVLDTSVLIGAFTGARRSAPALLRAIAAGERVAITTLVLYEWLRGPRSPAELDIQETIAPAAQALVLGSAEARVAAALYRRVKNPRSREMDIAIAACAIVRDATLWTLNVRDFADIPGLSVAAPG